MRLIQKLLPVLIVAGVLNFADDAGYFDSGIPRSTVEQPVTSTQDGFARAYAERLSNVQLQGSGRVTRLLADDNAGSRHQRFILELASGQTLLVAHNIDLAPRIDNLAIGDVVELYGEYEWNPEGGVMHWTHRDPQRRHEGGWIRHGGSTYR